MSRTNWPAPAGETLKGPCWEVSAGNVEPAEFLRALGILVEQGSVLVLEGGARPAELAAFTRSHAIRAEIEVAKGTVWPKTDVTYLPASSEVLDGLAAFMEERAPPELCGLDPIS
jgi:hypothetical protein